MKALVLGLLTALAVAVCGIVVLEGGDETAIAVIWLLAAFVVLDLLALVFVTVAGLWNVRRRAWRRPLRAVLLSAYLVIAPLGCLYGGSHYAQQVAEYDPSADCRNLLGSCTLGRTPRVARRVGHLRPPQLGCRQPPRPVEA